jgi:hypothetical protein
LLVAISLLGLTACGGANTSAPTTTAPTALSTPTTPANSASTPSSAPPGALQAEANSAAAGDIPDNQVFLVFRNDAAGYSMKYPEGWAQQTADRQVTFRDKNNIARVDVAKGAIPALATVRSELSALHGVTVTSSPRRIALPSGPAIKTTYTTVSAANAVTGKRVTLVVDRYYLSRGGRRAIVDLGTPVGVDNVDAYRLMIESFRWR